MERLRSKEGFICDMDGVIYHGNRLLPGVKEFVNWLVDNKKNFLFLTNSSQYTPRELQNKLARMGLDVDETHFYTSALATACFLDTQSPGCSAYVIGEHGDSEFVPWSQAMLATKPILSLCGETGGRNICREELDQIAEEVRSAAYRIIEAKNATYYGIGMALTRITKAILGDEHSVLTVSAMLKGEYGQSGVFAGVPCIINKNGIQSVLTLSLTEEELNHLSSSCETLRESYEGIL